MHPSSRPSVPPRSRRFFNRRTEVKPSQGAKREDKNMNTASSSPRRGTRGPPESSRLKGPSQGARALVVKSKLVRPQKNGAHAIPAISKPKSGHTVSNLVPAVDPNCNEPSLPCLCCDGHSPQDSNSLFNHNLNNNNTANIRQQMKLTPPPPPQKELAVPKKDIKEDESKPEVKQPHVIPVEERQEDNGNVDEKEGGQLKNDDSSVNVNANVDENGNGNCNGENGEDDEDDNDDEDDDTLVPSCCNCPESMLNFSLTSFTSSSSTSISSCSDLECDCPDTLSLSSQDQEATECHPSSRSPVSSCPAFQSNALPLDLNTSARSPCPSDEGYPSAPCSPSSDYIESKGSEEGKCIKVDLLHFLDSIEELGKMDLFYRIVRLAHWELDGELIIRDRLDHQQKLQRVNKEVKLAYLVKLQEEGLDFDDEDITGVLDEMGNIDIPCKLYKSNKSSESQEFSDAGVDMTAPSDLDETPASDSLAPSPLEPPPLPPKPPTRHVSAHSESHSYENISGHVFSVSSTNDATNVSTRVPTMPALSSSPPALKPPALPPPPSQPVPYFTLNTDRPALTSPTPPIPPPRRRHKARLEAQRLAELEREKTPLSLPPPVSRPPPLPPPPAMSSPPAVPSPPSLPQPPSFHTLDVEIRKLLALAGLTQAELLKLSPELGVCVDVVLDNEQQPMSDDSQIGEISVNRTHKEEGVDKGLHSRLKEGSIFGKDRSTGANELHTLSEKEICKDEQKEANRTTSFTEMARRRKRNGGHCNHSCSCGFGSNVSLSPSSYYSTDLSNSNIPNVSFGSFDYTSMISDTPPPPPPRPLPPCPPISSNPPELPPLKPCTLPANASRPDRFDWLIAFTPDTESPPLEMRKSLNDGMLQKGPSSTSGSKVTTFKELRNRSKQSSQPAPVQPEPDPTVITPDPDFLYNLKWRREKIDGDGWEYTSQAQASFLPPPPTPASLSLFREMCRLNIQEDCPAEPKVSQQIGSSVSEGSLRTICDERDKAVHTKKMDDEEKVEVRGMADGAWTLETRTSVSSPPLSLSLTSPYYLHSAPLSQFYHIDMNRDRAVNHCEGSVNISNPLCINSAFDLSKDGYTDSLYCAGPENNTFLFCKQENDLNGNMDSLYHRCNHPDSFLDSYICGHDFDSTKNIFCPHNSGVDSLRNDDSLYSDARDTRSSLKLFTDPEPPTDINTLTEGDITPYKNIDMQTYITMRNLKNQSYANKNSYKDVDSLFDLNSDNIEDSKQPINPFFDHNSNENTAQNKQQLVSFPAYYLYHPKNCPLHKGAPPRLSPVGAISPPHRSGPPVPGTDVARLCSPPFPRSHTLPALAAPLYYPYLYAPPVQAPLREPSVPILPSQQSPPPLTLTVRSFSFAGSEQKNAAWMGEDVRPSLSAEGLSSACLQEKKILVNSVSVAVEAILAQFSSSRTVVQKFHSVDKTLSGDSSVNPCLGRLVLQCLCPALRSLLSDGLKPHQSDLIAGRRPNSPWGLVQASTKPGPSTQALHNLQTKVAGLPQLKQSRHKFNAFLFGLLNVKLLDYWLSHLQSSSDVLETYYRPTSFMRLSLTSCQPLFEELLLLLQPLSLLTFNLDLLFQHHHLDPSSPTLTPASHTSEIYSPPNEDFSFHLSPKGLFQGSSHHLGSVLQQDQGSLSLDLQSGLTSHILDLSAYRNPISLSSGDTKEEASLTLSWFKGSESSMPLNAGSLSQQAGQALQQGWGAVMRFGERLGQNFGLATSTEVDKSPNSPGDFKTGFSLNPKSPDEKRQQPRDDLSLKDNGAAVPWGLGRLFGASKSPNNPPASRRPSQWLSPGASVLSRIVNLGQGSPPEKREPQRSKDKEEDEKEEINETGDQPKPLMMVRTLCDHTGAGAELSFRKGEELVLLGGVNHDWIRCRQGHKEGLVPIGYASLIM
uniref:RUN and SH3 domain-containing protein 1 n=1 Tax=Cyprinus carpio TaxID=7962 RepID=A0A8C1GW36_CYPCA